LSSGIALRLQYLTNHLTFNVAQGPIPGQADLWVSGDIIAGGYGNHGGILKTGAGLMELSGTDSVDGGTTVIDGTLLVDGSAVVTTPVTVQGAGTLDLAGTINAPVTFSAGGLLRGTGTIRGALTNDSDGTLAPGQSSIGTLNLAGTLTLDAGSTNVMRINKTGSTLTADLVNLTGTSGVAYSGTLRILASPGSDALAPGDKFILFAKSAGAFTGSFGALDLPALGAGMVWYTGDLTTDGSIAVLSTSAVATPTFDPPAGSYVGAQAVSIRCGTAGATIHYTIDNTTPNTSSPVYSNAIVVPASATMTIQALATKPGYADSAVGSASYLTQPAAIWTSLFGGSWTQAGNWTNNILANGRGVPALFNTLTLVGDAIVTLDSPPTVGYLAFGDVGSNYNWQVNAGTGGPLILDAATSPTLQVDNQTATITAVLAGTNGLIKTGGGTLALTAINTYNGGTVVSNGTLTLGGAGSSGVIRGALTINSGAQVEADTGWALGFGLGSACVTNIIIDGGTLNFTGAAPPAGGGTSATNITIVGGTLSGTQFHWYQGLTTSPSLTTLPSSTTAVLSSGIAIRLQYPSNNITFDVARGTTASGVDLLVSGDISPGGWGNHGGILKAGVGVLVLAGTDSCDGGTTVSGGTLLVDSAGVVSTPVTVQGGTLAGNGTINAPVTVNAGGTLAPGGSLAIGTLLISSPLTLNVGSTTMARLDKAAAINDSVSGIGTLTYGGTLTVTNLAGTLAEGDAFQVFSAAANSGNFAAMNLPALGAGLAWSWTPENGTLTVVKAAIPPVLSGYGPLSGSSFPLTFSGPSGQTYKVLMSTNVALPLPSWTVLTSDTFGASPVTYTDTGATNVHRFYRITSP
jgi:autotransporter-associated beta strand protein